MPGQTSKPLSPERAHRRAVTATVVGNFVESFDWLGYGLFAHLFAARFFPSSNPVTSLIGAFAVLGIGVLVRPLGGILLGRLADRRGRRPALMLAISLMTAGSVLIGITPTYDQIGFLAPAVLILARIAQGISSGGEWPAAAAYLMEVAPQRRKSLYGSLFSLTTVAGAFTASLLGGGLTAVLGSEAMASWGWRVPFLVGGLFGAVLMIMRRQLAETEVFRREAGERPARGSLRQVLVTYRRQVLRSVLFIAGMAVVGGTWTSVVPSMGQKLAPGLMFWVVVCATAILMIVNVPIGLLADKVGARRFLLSASVAFAVAGSYTFLTIEGTFTSLLFTYLSGTVYLTCVTTTLPGILCELFPTENRALGLGLPNAVTSAVLGGIAPALATYLGERGASGWFVAGVMAMVLLAWPAVLIRSPAPAPTSKPSGFSLVG
ncbi:MFS transporter [Streptomyces sp. BE308]|uniref:MFS transporter n=1 Tax=unclassified Streptomyces TaxID=2593676 RepID=UPI002DD843A6|nr:MULTISPECIES: MFS transporter [unclassified Streptomyces]MEE1791156.1 MFS transporter [Streptomyces sp. BE308]WRZ78604.1 MFS transporter [Streptomyces sp. NBC_01237]